MTPGFGNWFKKLTRALFRNRYRNNWYSFGIGGDGLDEQKPEVAVF